MYLLDKEDAKTKIDDSDIEIKRVMTVRCHSCSTELTIFKDDEDEVRDYLIDELDWSIAEEISDEDGETEHFYICDECKLTIVDE